MAGIDLHTHTTASDGSLPPRELVAAAHRQGLAALAITDHDTLAGLAEGQAAADELGIELVPGVELSVEAGLPGGLHLLGLYLDPGHPGLAGRLAFLQESRAARNRQIVANLNRLGIGLSEAEVAKLAGGDLVSRAHFAQALVARGAVRNRGEAFARYLGPGKPGYAPKFRLPPAEAAGLIRAAGGVPVAAHPGLWGLDRRGLEAMLRRLAAAGVEGVEAYYSEHDGALTGFLVGLAARLGLVVTGGSDFHGGPKPEIGLGLGRGDLRVPAALLPALQARRDRIRAHNHAA